MNENTALNARKSKATVKNVLRVLSALCIIFVFCPSFLVSCGTEDVEVSALKAITGVSYQGEQIVEPRVIMSIVLIIPIVIFVLLFIDQLKDKERTIASISIVSMIVDIIMWFVFRSEVKKMAAELGCGFKSTGWFVLNLISMIAITGLSILITANIYKMETDLMTIINSNQTQSNPSNDKE